MIDYALQLRKFNQIAQLVKISANAQALYFHILSNFDSNYYPEMLKLDNRSLHKSTQLSREKLRKARLELQKLSLIDYSKGSGSASGIYIIFDLQQKDLKEICKDCLYLEENAFKPKIDDFNKFARQLDNSLTGDSKILAQLILNTLKKALTNQQTGIFNGSYTAAQTFITAKNELTIETIYKLIATLKNKPNIQNKEAYILATLKNEAEHIRDKEQFNELVLKYQNQGATPEQAYYFAEKEWNQLAYSKSLEV